MVGGDHRHPGDGNEDPPTQTGVASPLVPFVTPHPIQPVRIDEKGDVWTLGGARLRDHPPEAWAALIVAGFHHATPMRSTEEVLAGTGVKVKRRTG